MVASHDRYGSLLLHRLGYMASPLPEQPPGRVRDDMAELVDFAAC